MLKEINTWLPLWTLSISCKKKKTKETLGTQLIVRTSALMFVLSVLRLSRNAVEL